MSKILTEKEWKESVAEAFSAAVESAYEDMLRAAVLAEREACAKVCEDLYANLNDDLDCRKRWPEQKRRNEIYAAVIRARGQK